MGIFRAYRRRAVGGIILVIAAMLLSVAHAADKGKIKVMTQNQYLGADLTPLVLASGAEDPAAAFNSALIGVLTTIGASNYPERVLSLAQTIIDKSPDLVGLQEIWAFGCTPTSPTITDPCGLFGPAFSDHLQATLDTLDLLGGDYYLAAQSQNLTVVDVGFPVPGVPLFLDDDANPDIFVTVIDRDVILAREKVPTTPVTYSCRNSLDGCNFSLENVAQTSIGGIPLNIERGFVAVDAVVKGDSYRFVNTHLEVRFPDPTNPLSSFFQSAQASELLGILTTQAEPADSRLIVVGDINSDPNDDTGPFLTPYRQFALGLAYDGMTNYPAFYDVWTLQRKPTLGLTCCEEEDLLNPLSVHDRRVDVIFSLDRPGKVQARALNTDPADKTPSGLWPSDHATVAATLKFQAGE